MKKSQPNYKRNRLIAAGLLASIFLFSLTPRVWSIYKLSSQKQELLQEKARLAQINAQQQQILDSINTPAGIEKIAREQLGMIKKGEKAVVRVVPAK